MLGRKIISSVLFMSASLFAVSANASDPQLPKTVGWFGSWHVRENVIDTQPEVEGVNYRDYFFASLDQAVCDADKDVCDELQIQWTNGSSVTVSANFGTCKNELGRFKPFYFVPAERWIKKGPAMERQIELDFEAWLRQAYLMCEKPERAGGFRMKQLKPAVRAFTRTLSKFHDVVSK
jgi:hypothetical protein